MTTRKIQLVAAPDQAPWDGFLPPAINNLSQQLLRDPDATAEAIGRAAPVREFRLLTPLPQFFLSIAHQPIGQALLTSYASSDFTFLTEDVPSLHLVVCRNGRRRVVTSAGAVECRAGGALLLPPGQRRAFGSHSAIIITLQPAAIATTASAMVGQDTTGPWAAAAHNSARSFAPQAFAPVAQAEMLHQLIVWIDHCLGCDPALPDRLGADDVVLRQVAALLNPELLREQPGDGERLRERQGRSAFDDLIDHIRANLDQPLRLSDLEARSHYSRRSPQYAFQEKLGCSPMAWIRAQRLERAMERLRDGGPELTLKAVALACGYRLYNQFSSDFQRRFGIKPSEAKRPRL